MRQHHYRFAHQQLATAVLSDPDAWWSALTERGSDAVSSVWEAAGEGLDPTEVLELADLQVERIDDRPVDAVVITLPTPTAPTECYFIAVVNDFEDVRYYVLEKGFDRDGGGERAYWSEWRTGASGLIRIRGVDVEPIGIDAFLNAIAADIGPDDTKADVVVTTPPPSPSEGSGPPPSPFDVGAPAAEPPAAAAPPAGAVFPADGGGFSQSAPGPAPTARVSSGAGKRIGCALVALLLVGGCLGGLGYGYWLEEGYEPGAPGPTIVETKTIKPGKPFTVRFDWDGTGYAFNEVWVDVTGKKSKTKKDGGFALTGKVGCARGGRPKLKRVHVAISDSKARRVETKKKRKFSAWFEVWDGYDRSGSREFVCKGTLDAKPGKITKARIVVTRRQRPSDFVAQ